MTSDELVHKTAAINYEIVIRHGLDGGIGFEWQGIFIHDPYMDPQYGAFIVDPVRQYGDAFTGSIFVTNPGSALQMAQRQVRDKANENLRRYCTEHGEDAAAVVESVLGINVPMGENALEALEDEQVAAVWSYVDGAA